MTQAMARCTDLDAQRHNVAREHVLDGVAYLFPARGGLDVPLDVAVKFLVPNPGFMVTDSAGNQIRAERTLQPETPGSAAVVLKADETIARFEDLTAEALRDRCEKIEGFEEADIRLKDDLVAFLIAQAGASTSLAGDAPVAEDDDEGEAELERED